MLTNYALIDYQKNCFDNNPSMMIIPLLNPSKAAEWRGEGYDAIIVVDGFGNLEKNQVIQR